MTRIQELFDNNKAWSKRQLDADPEYFNRLTALQKPKYLWIGCSDSRVPANQILGLAPGEVFVHRNVANLVVHSDLNCLSVIQFAVEVLQVEHIIVCGHYGCGGINAACSNTQFGLIDNWLRNIKDTYDRHRAEIEEITDPEARHDKVCELNVLTQVLNVCHTTIVQNAWARGQNLEVHGIIYRLNDGLLHDLAVHVTSLDQIEEIYRLGVFNRRSSDRAAE